jgi:hypothetical protein
LERGARDSFTLVRRPQRRRAHANGFSSQIAAAATGEPSRSAGHFSDKELWRNVMRLFFAVVGVLAWVWALAVLWIFAESGGALTVIAAGVFAIVAIIALGCERIIKTLEDIRDGNVPATRVVSAPVERVKKASAERKAVVQTPLGTQSV